jgi:ComF family protein
VHRTSKIFKAFANLFFPEFCYSCGSDLVSREQLLCLRCLHHLPFTRFEKIKGNPVEKIFWGRIPIEFAASLLYLTKGSIVERLLHQLKYRSKKEVGIYCGRLMGQALKKSGFSEKIDFIVPLPLFKRKERQRGYNQARLICDGLAETLNIPISTEMVERIESTETQTHKNRVERWFNMRGRFRVKAADEIQNKHLILVDDVITTGATLESCAQELLKAGARVSIYTLGYSSSKNV